MFCTNCGRELKDDMKFCPDCGTKVEAFELFPEKTAEEAVEEVAEPVVEAVEEAAEAVGEAAEPVVEAVEEAAEPVIEAAEEAAEVVEEAAVPVIAAAEEAAREIEQAAEETVEEIAEPAVEAVEEAAEETSEAVEEAAEEAAEVFEEAAEAVEETVQEAAEPVAEAIEDAAPAAEEIVPDATPIVDEIVEDATPIVDEIAPDAAPVVEETAVEAAPEAAAEEPQKKKSKTPLIIVLVLVVLAVAGYFIYQNLDSTKYGKLKKQIDAAMEQKDYAAAQPLIEEAMQYERDTEILQEYDRLCKIDAAMEQKDYEAALPIVEEALQYEPDNEELKEYYRLCKMDQVFKFHEAGDLKAFISAAEAHIKEFPKSESELLPVIEDAYYNEAEKVLKTNDLAKVKELRTWLASAYETGKYPSLKGQINKADEAIELLQLKQLFAAFAADLQKTMTPTETNDPAGTFYIATFDCIRDELLKGSGKYRTIILSEDKMKALYPLILDKDENGKAWAFYYTDNRYFIYYGEFNGTKREGDGMWICADNQTTSTTWREYIARGNWKDDLPNGQFAEYRRTKYTNSTDIEILFAQANIKNGLYDGEVQLTYANSKTLKGTFKDGHPNVIETKEDANGEKRDITFISDDGTQYISIPAGSVQTRGIYGFAN